MATVRNIPLEIWNGVDFSPVGIRCELGGMKFIAVLDSGESDDIHLEPIDAWKLGVVVLDSNGNYAGPGPHSTFIGANRLGRPRFMTEIEIEDFSGPFDIPTTVYPRGDGGPILVPLTYFTRMYSVNISQKYITFMNKHEGGYKYLPTDLYQWYISNESRTPPFVACSINDVEFTAILDTGAINGRGVLTTETAKRIGIEQYPPHTINLIKRGKIYKAHTIPFMLEDLGPFMIDFTIEDQYQDGNIIPIDPFIINGGSITFNENSAEFYLGSYLI